MQILIGSRALKYWVPEFRISEDADWDVISDKPLWNCEWHKPSVCNNADVWKYASLDSVELPDGSSAWICKPKGLALIKRSHLWRTVGFEKSIVHWHKYLKHFTQDLNSDDLLFLSNRIQKTKEQFPQRHPSLKQSVEDFFDDYVEKKYNHDFLHELVAFHDKPLYTRMQRDPSSAWCEKDLWDNFSYDDKVRCVAEECFVISIERFLVPQDWAFNPKIAYSRALNKVCTTLCSGWFRDFAIDNYPEVMQQFNKQLYQRVQVALSQLD